MQLTTRILGQSDLIEEMIARYPQAGKLIDIGTGSGLAARRFLQAGWEVSASGFDMEAYFDGGEALPPEIERLPDLDICDMKTLPDHSFDAVWCAHVLEHVSDTGKALAEIRRILKPDGKLFLTVPPYKPKIVGGHVNTGWNLGSLIYVLADAGFGLGNGSFVQHGYNVFGVVERGPGALPSGRLRRANGDLEILAQMGRLPPDVELVQGTNGNRLETSWKWLKAPTEIAVPRKEQARPAAISAMRIGFVVPWITQNMGGTENVGQMMANAMASFGHKVSIFTFDNAKQPPSWALHEDIELVHLNEGNGPRADRMMMVELASRNLDLIVGLHMNRTFVRYIRCAQKLSIPIVVSEHIDPRFPDWAGSFDAEERIAAFSGATAIHLLVDAFRSSLPEFLQSRIKVVPNTVREPDALAKLDAPKTTRNLLLVARLVPRKNVAEVIEVFAALAPHHPDWRLQIVGDGPLMKELKKRVAALGLKKRISFEGHQRDPYPYYRDADLFVIPSRFEGLPLTLCEALAHGLPAVGYDICNGVNEQIIHGQNGFLAKAGEGQAALASALGQLMENDQLRVKTGAAARQSFENRYANNVVYHAWEEMFAEAVLAGSEPIQPTARQAAFVHLHRLIWGDKSLTQKGVKYNNILRGALA